MPIRLTKTPPVLSVNGQTGSVTLSYSDVGAAPSSHSHPASQISDSTTVGRALLTGASQSANLIFAGPSSGGAAAPTFRAMVKADQVSTTAYTDAANIFSANQTVAVDFAGLSGTGSFPQVTARQSTLTGGTVKRVSMGYSSLVDAGIIQAIHDSVAFKALHLNPNGGFIGIGLGSSAPGYPLEIAGASSGATVTSLAINNSGTGSNTAAEFIFRLGGAAYGRIVSMAAAGGGNNRMDLMPDGTTPRLSIYGSNVGIGTTTANTLLHVNGNAKMSHVVGGSSTPSIAAGSGAGTTPTISISGTDLSGTITLTTGTTPATGVIATITFATAYGAAPQFTPPGPNNANAAALTGTSNPYFTTTTTTLVLNSGSAALAAATQYKWTYGLSQ